MSGDTSLAVTPETTIVSGMSAVIVSAGNGIPTRMYWADKTILYP